MNEDTIATSQNTNGQGQNGQSPDLDLDIPAEQVFDINSDLTISPFKKETPSPTAPEMPGAIKEIPPAYSSPSINLMNKDAPVVPLHTAPLVPPPATSKPSFVAAATPFTQPLKKINLLDMEEPAPTSAAQKTNSELNPIRTYEGDVAKVMSHKGTSLASMTIAENKKNEGTERIGNAETEAPSHTLRNILVTFSSLILIIGGAYAAYHLYSISPLFPSTTSPQSQQPQKISGIIGADTQVVLPIDNLSNRAISSKILAEIAKEQRANSIKEIVLTQTSNGSAFRISGPDMIAKMDIPAPDILVRSLTNPWMLGVYANENQEKSLFVIVTNNFFQNTFAGMLQWEHVMADDLRAYVYSTESVRGIANTSSPLVAGTSTAAYVTLRGQFQDRILKNKDVREFIQAEGETLFLYSFIDNTKLVIAGNEATLSEIVTRLEKQAFVR